MKLSITILTIIGIMFLNKPATAIDTVQCVLQAFGTGLEDKGIRVQVNDPGFSCGPFSTTPIISSANFVGGEAEVPLTLQANSLGICAQSINVWVTLPYSCDKLSRAILDVGWGHGSRQLGSCRVLQQKCGSTVSAAAIPYIDMWCRRPPSFGGNPEEMRIRWAFNEPEDKC